MFASLLSLAECVAGRAVLKENFSFRMEAYDVLCAVDSSATADIVDTETVISMKTDVDCRINIMEHPLYQAVHKCYTDAQKYIEFRQVEFNGVYQFGVFATTTFERGVTIPCLTGFLAEVPLSFLTADYDDFSSLHTKRGVTLIMRGPARFVNHDCDPNAVFSPQLKEGRLHIRVKRRILSGEEITTHYGSRFFDKNECLCKCCAENPLERAGLTRASYKIRKHPTSYVIPRGISKTTDSTTESSPISPTGISIEPPLPDCQNAQEPPSANQKYPSNLRKRSSRIPHYYAKRCTKPVLLPDPESDVELSDLSDFSDVISGAITSTPVRVASDSSESFFHSTSDGESAQYGAAATMPPDYVCDTYSLDSLPTDCSGSDDDDHVEFESSDGDYCDPSNSEQTFLNESSDQSVISTDEGFLFNGSDVKLKTYKTEMCEIYLTHSLSDKAMINLLNFQSRMLGKFSSKLPSFASIKNDAKRVLDTFSDLIPMELGETLVLNVENQLFLVVGRHIEQLLAAPSRDFHGYPTSPDPGFHLTLHLILNTDGVPLVRSERISAWPVWAIIMELNSRARTSFANVLLLALYVGKGDPNRKKIPNKPEWPALFSVLVPQLETLRKRGFAIVHEGRGVLINVRCSKFTGDAPATASICNKMGHGATHPCTYCLAEMRDRRIDQITGLIPRTNEHYQECVQLAIQPRPKRRGKNIPKQNFFGIKGHADIADLVLFPDDIVVDPMHQLDEGVLKTSLTISLEKKLRSNSTTYQVRMPHSFRRKSRSIKLHLIWKASEFRNFLVFYGPCVLFFDADLSFFHAIAKLSTAITTLLLPDRDHQELDTAKAQIESVVADLYKLLGSALKIFNTHQLLHFVDQYRRTGPLWTVSGYPFESHNQHLAKMAHGSNSHLQQIARKFLLRQKLSSERHPHNSPYDLNVKLLDKTKPPVGVIFPDYEESLNELQCYQRARYNLQTFHSVNYRRLLVENSSSQSYHVTFYNRGKCYGQIQIFAELMSGAHVAVIKLYNDIQTFGKFAGYPELLGSHMVVQDTNELVVVPVQNLERLCVKLEIDDLLVLIETFDHYEHD